MKQPVHQNLENGINYALIAGVLLPIAVLVFKHLLF